MKQQDKDAFRKAFAMAYKFVREHMTGHDADQLANLREHIERGSAEFETADEFIKGLYRRTDLSDDDKWELECHEVLIEHIFDIYKLHAEINQLNKAEESRYD